MFSTLGDVQYIGGYFEYFEGCSVHRRVIRVVWGYILITFIINEYDTDEPNIKNIGQAGCWLHIPKHLTSMLYFGLTRVIQIPYKFSFQSDPTNIESTL